MTTTAKQLKTLTTDAARGAVVEFFQPLFWLVGKLLGRSVKGSATIDVHTATIDPVEIQEVISRLQSLPRADVELGVAERERLENEIQLIVERLQLIEQSMREAAASQPVNGK